MNEIDDKPGVEHDASQSSQKPTPKELGSHYQPPFNSSRESRPVQDMSRSMQTAWIVTAIFLVGLILGTMYRLNTKDECENFFGGTNKECAGNRALAQIYRRF